MRESGIPAAYVRRAMENGVFRALMGADGGADGVPARVERLRRGESLVRRGEPLRALFFPVEGTLKVSLSTERGQTLLIAFYRARGVIGDVELMDGGGAGTWVEATTDAVCLSVRAADCRERLRTNAPFAAELARALAEKLRRCTDESAARALTPLPERLAAYLREAAQDGALTEPLTVVAESLGVSYRHLMRAMRALEGAGLVTRDGGRVRVATRP